MNRIQKYIFASLFTITFALSAYSQNALTGKVMDENNEALSYATVALLNPADSILKYFGVTNDEGVFQMKSIKKGAYLLQYSFVGMETTYETIKIPVKGGEDLGIKILTPDALEGVTIIEEYVPVTFKSDTVEFSAKAFSTKTNAVVEDLLKKIPGVEVDESGNVKAMGEDVQKILVDGKEFFGKDPRVATKNLPAIAIDKVQVYDKKSDEAEFSGIDDGVRDRTINLMLNEDHKKGYFGNVEAGLGTGSHYGAGGRIYRFSEKLQTAFLGMYNNVNEFGFAQEKPMGFGQSVEGENTSGAGGLNLSYNKKGNNRYFLSYLGSSTRTILEQEKSTENFLKDVSYFQKENLDRESLSTPHKINFGVRHNFKNKQNIILDGDIKASSGNGNQSSIINSMLNANPINTLYSLSNNESNSISASANGSYIVKLNDGKTQLKTGISANYYKNSSLLDWQDSILFFSPDSLDLYSQFRDDRTDGISFSLSPSVVQKLKQFWYLTAGLHLSSNTQSISRQHDIFQFSNEIVGEPTPDFYTEELKIRPGLSLKRNSNKSQLDFKLGSSWDQFSKVEDGTSLGKPVYFFILPGLSYEYKYKKGRRINFRYSTSANMPGVSQLYPYSNNENLLSVYHGNTSLTPEFIHNLSLSWWYFDQFSFTSIFARMGASYTKDKIGISRYTNEDLLTEIMPVNTPDQRMAYSHISFSTPIRRLGVKVNLVSTESLSRGYTIINGEDNIQTNLTHALRLRIDNRKKEIWDAGIGGSISITDANYSISSMNTVYYNTGVFSDIRFTPSDKWNFEATANVVNYNSQSFEESVLIPLLSAEISYHFLTGERATISLAGYDLLNRQVGYQRISSENFLIEREWNTLGRYVALEFNLRIGK
jgi:hypothetical protein